MPKIGLPRPEHWTDKTGALTFGLILFGGGGALCVAWAAEVVSRREYLTAIVMVGFAIFVLGTVLAIAVTQFGWIAPRAELDSLGTVLRVDRVFARLMSTAIGAFIPSGILFIFLAPTGRLDIPLNHGQQIFLPFGVAFMVCLSVLAMYRAKLRGGWSYLRLTPDRFELVTVFNTAVNGLWDDVVDVRDEVAQGSRGRLPAVMVMKHGAPQVINGLNGYTPRGRALYWMIRHYWLHPENRGELGDGRAIARLHKEDFEVE